MEKKSIASYRLMHLARTRFSTLDDCGFSQDRCRYARSFSLDGRSRSAWYGLIIRHLLLIVVLVIGTGVHASAAQNVLVGAHAHNDYEHKRPLHDALDHGFRSIEVDVHLVEGGLLVAHDRVDVEPSRTLQALYLDPLRERVRRRGSVYGEDTPLLLLVDVKSEAEATYRVLRSVLRRYADILTIYSGDEAVDGAVTVVISGSRARETMLNEAVRFAALDGRPGDLVAHADMPTTFMPLISAPWSTVSTWRGAGPMPPDDREKLRHVVASSRAQGRMLRFWATPDTPAVWDVLTGEGVDLIGTDDLTALSDYFGQRAPRPARD